MTNFGGIFGEGSEPTKEFETFLMEIGTDANIVIEVLLSQNQSNFDHEKPLH